MFQALDEKEQSVVEQVNQMLKFKPGQLTGLLQTLATITSDRQFVEQMLKINEDINDLADSDGEEELAKEKKIDEERNTLKEERETKELLEKEKWDVVPVNRDKYQQIDLIDKKQVIIYESLHFKDVLQALMKKLKQVEYRDHFELFRSWAKQLAVS